MKKIFLILSLLFSIASFGQFGRGLFYSQKKSRDYTQPINIKNPKIFYSTLPGRNYLAFGNFQPLGRGTNKKILFTRAADAHLKDATHGTMAGVGIPCYIDYYADNDSIGSIHVIRTDTVDNRDVWATWMSPIDSGVVWSQISHNGQYGDYSSDIYQIRYDSNMNFTDTIRFRWPANRPRLQRGVVGLGTAAETGVDGEYFIALLQWNVDTGNLSRTRVDMVHTTDYFRTYTLDSVWDGTGFPVSEAWVVNVSKTGGTKDSLVLLLRIDLGSGMYTYTTSNRSTWIPRGTATPLWWWGAGLGDYIPGALRMNDTTIHFIYTNRDNFCMDASVFNNPQNFFPGYTFNAPQMYFYNKSGDYPPANSNLGYISGVPIDATHAVLSWAHEAKLDTSFLYISRTDFLTDPAGIPIAPLSLDISSISATQFRVDVTGYSQVQMNNIRYLQFDLSTDSAFGSFVTAKYQNPNSFPTPVLLHNIYMNSYWDTFNELTTGTTYYLRIKACNNVGCSDYTTTTITTN